MQSFFPRRPYSCAAEVHAGDVVRMCHGIAPDESEPEGYSDCLVVEVHSAGNGAVELARVHLSLSMACEVQTHIERFRVELPLFVQRFQLLTTGRLGGRDNRVHPMTVYYTVHIPWSDKPTKWHPTEHSGPFSVLQRGAFATRELAETWARKELGDTVFYVRRIDPMADAAIEAEFEKHTGKTVAQSREELRLAKCPICSTPSASSKGAA
jgi:hypothetical protein